MIGGGLPDASMMSLHLRTPPVADLSLSSGAVGGRFEDESSVLLTDERLVSLPSKLAEIARHRPGSARVVTPLRKHVDTLIEDETGQPPSETPEEYAARLEQERAEEEELMRRLKEEEEEAARKAAQILEEEAALQRCALHTYTHPPPAL